MPIYFSQFFGNPLAGTLMFVIFAIAYWALSISCAHEVEVIPIGLEVPGPGVADSLRSSLIRSNAFCGSSLSVSKSACWQTS